MSTHLAMCLMWGWGGGGGWGGGSPFGMSIIRKGNIALSILRVHTHLNVAYFSENISGSQVNDENEKACL